MGIEKFLGLFSGKNNEITEEEKKIIKEKAKKELDTFVDKMVLDSLRNVAIVEAEDELGTDHLFNEDKYVGGSLKDSDSDYISKVEKKVKNKLEDPEWVKKNKERLNTTEKKKKVLEKDIAA